MGKARTIGMLANEVGVSVETVRYYEREGLIDKPRRSEGPRHYDDQALAMLKYIRIAQGFGLTLREIKSLRSELSSGRGFCVSLRSLVAAKVEEIQRKQIELAKLSTELEAFLVRCEKRPAHLSCPVIDELMNLNHLIPSYPKETVSRP